MSIRVVIKHGKEISPMCLDGRASFKKNTNIALIDVMITKMMSISQLNSKPNKVVYKTP